MKKIESLAKEALKFMQTSKIPFIKEENIDISKFQIGGKFECRKDYTDLDLENAVYPEYLIHRVSPDGKLCIAGQIDLLVKKAII